MGARDIHNESLATADVLSSYYVPDALPSVDVICTLNKAGVNFMLIGTHAIGGWMQKPRATQDVDVLVAAQHHEKAARALLTAFPQLERVDEPALTRLRNRMTKQVAIDIVKPQRPLELVALVRAKVLDFGGQPCKIPSLEAALAMKFASMNDAERQQADRFQDAHDFARMACCNPQIDWATLAELGELVYPRGGKEVVEQVRRVRAGEKLEL